MTVSALADDQGSPTQERDRIETLDVLRGFALLGILLLNIIGFGMLSSAYSNPAEGFIGAMDMPVWAGIDILAEGAMRGLFSILFGAGVVLFTLSATQRSAGHFYRRHLWLLAFGLFDAYVLLWNGDILINYALAGMLLYFARDSSPRRLLLAAAAVTVLMCIMYALMGYGLGQAQAAATVLAGASDPEAVSASVREAAATWHAFAADYQFTPEQRELELAARQDSYLSAFQWNAAVVNGMLLFVLPVFLLWDALAFMLLGMALYKLGILQGQRSSGFYVRLAIAGFGVGLLINSFEVYRAWSHEFALLATFAQAQATYHLGRLGMALGYLALIVLAVQAGWFSGLRRRLACVGRMALTNYLMHSLICLLLFTGAGFALVGELTRAQLYIVVLAIWILQLWFSPWWLARFQYGPVEWLWRGLTYGGWPPLSRKAVQ